MCERCEPIKQKIRDVNCPHCLRAALWYASTHAALCTIPPRYAKQFPAERYMTPEWVDEVEERVMRELADYQEKDPSPLCPYCFGMMHLTLIGVKLLSEVIRKLPQFREQALQRLASIDPDAPEIHRHMARGLMQIYSQEPFNPWLLDPELPVN